MLGAFAVGPLADRRGRKTMLVVEVGSFGTAEGAAQSGRNKALAGSGTGASLGYVEIDATFMDMVGTKVTNQPVTIELDQAKRNYLHPVAGSEAAKVGAGLFTKP
jgi:secreted protein with Ig-like and vWFA domain